MSLWGNVPFLVVSSLRKLDKKDDEPNLDWFRGTSQLGYAAWAACVVTRGELEDAKKGWREVVVTTVKNKGGRSGQSVKARLWGGYSCMREVNE